MGFSNFPGWLKAVTVIIFVIDGLILATSGIIVYNASVISHAFFGFTNVMVVFYPILLGSYAVWSIFYSVYYKKWRFLVSSLVTAILMSLLVIPFA